MKEYLCEMCSHCSICRLSKSYQDIVNKVRNAIELTDADEQIVYLSDPKCKYYASAYTDYPMVKINPCSQ